MCEASFSINSAAILLLGIGRRGKTWLKLIQYLDCSNLQQSPGISNRMRGVAWFGNRCDADLSPSRGQFSFRKGSIDGVGNKIIVDILLVPYCFKLVSN